MLLDVGARQAGADARLVVSGLRGGGAAKRTAWSPRAELLAVVVVADLVVAELVVAALHEVARQRWR